MQGVDPYTYQPLSAPVALFDACEAVSQPCERDEVGRELNETIFSVPVTRDPWREK